MKRFALLAVFGFGCPPHPDPLPDVQSRLSIKGTGTVYVAFASDSTVTGDDWSFCEGEKLSCSFELDGEKELPIGDQYISATFAFDAAVGCGSTKAEVTLNKTDAYDTVDISLVDGYSNDVKITFGDTVLQNGARGTNADALGVFPYGCDLCAARGNPPCGIPSGGDGCKSGTQYDPKPPCQVSGTTKGGGTESVLVELVG